MSEVTRILSAIDGGDPHAAEELLPLVYDELRKLAAARLRQEKPGQTLDATALVHEAYLRLVGDDNDRQLAEPRPLLRGSGRGHATHPARTAPATSNRQKRGGGRRRIDLDDLNSHLSQTTTSLIALDEALEKLEREDYLAARLVKLRFFAGLTLKQAAESLGLSERTAERQWAYARAWLFHELSRDQDQSNPSSVP